MRQLAGGLQLLRGFPPNAINVYLAGDVLIDAATRRAEKRIMSQIDGHPVSANHKLRAGQTVRIEWPVLSAPRATRLGELHFPVLYEDDVLFAVDKPAMNRLS